MARWLWTSIGLVSCGVGPGGPSGLDPADLVSPAPATDPVATHGALSVAPRVAFDPAPGTVAADGRSAIDLRLTLEQPNGDPAPDGIVLPVTTDLGTITSVTPSVDGHVRVVLRAGTWPGTARLDVPGYAVDVQGSVELVVAPGRAAQLHTHGSLSEGNASMSDHLDDAAATGVDVVWFTDHAEALHPWEYGVDGFDFEDGTTTQVGLSFGGDVVSQTLVHRTLPEAGLGAEVVADAAASGAYGLRLAGHVEDVAADPVDLVLKVDGSTRATWRPLLAGVTLQLAVRPHAVARPVDLHVVVPLSSTPTNPTQPESGDAVVVVIGEAPVVPADDGKVAWVPIAAPADEWTVVELDLTEIARERIDRGVDVHAEFIRVEATVGPGEDLGYDLDDLAWRTALDAEPILGAARELLAGSPSPVTAHVGYEASGGGVQHFNAYGSLVRLPPAELVGAEPFELVDFVHAQGGVVSLNHIFGANERAEDGLADLYGETLEQLLATEAYGVDLIEVGYPNRLLLLADHVAVWDALSDAGVWLTGLGAADNHNRAPTREERNRWITWVSSATELEEDLAWNLRRGVAWFGDPVALPVGLTLWLDLPAAGATMGQVAPTPASGTAEVHVVAGPLRQGHTARLVSRGEVVELEVPPSGSLDAVVPIGVAGLDRVRVELIDGDGRTIALSNPVFFAPEEHADRIPAHRLPSPH